ncbi:Conserved oligomeric Golgi complex subunit 5 [Caenorhabditis elegans]|uniref:Conserved oligomeric Golgi complex subunit 5 n=1 Tax=Caenorhabditis elegans TaxID=6239 RepID=P91151_CAEEL|nr:Conserved oligomeric Golgi complex subunit 5 [Caenorhabditis elegans]CCD65163.1 Conserved oligomeric Golgi complex subunit 5 [Caenorhabditis elegans]|eukprot:NP_491339.2 Conserved Oligomeric Golgi (COG) Component [Caenorhabditis elegans]
MSGRVDEQLDDFLWGKTDVKDYLKKVAECDSSVAESLNRKVAGLHDTLDKQLRKGVETNLPRLLEQVPALQSLEDTLHSVQMRMTSVTKESNRLATVCDDLTTKLREQTRQLEATMLKRNMASDAQRCEELFESLEKRSDLVKKAEITSEIKEILNDNKNLRKIGWLKNMVDTKLKVAENEVRRSGAEELKRGLASLNSSMVVSAQRALRTLNYLDSELEVLLSSSVVDLDKKLMELSNSSPEVANKSLPVVAATIQSHLEQAAMLGEVYKKKFSEKLARLIRSRVPLDTPYALRFVQQLGRVFNSKGDSSPALNDSLRPLKNSLLTHSLARLHKLVEENDFSTAHANAFVDLINSAMEEEHRKVDWDAELSQKMSNNIEKCIEIIAKKLEANLHLQRDDLLLGDRLTANQMTNYRLIQTADGITKRWPAESKSVTAIQKETLDAIVIEVKNSIRAIVARMHVETRGMTKSVAPYMQELLTYINHIDMHMAHVSRAVCHSHVLSQIAEYVIDSFILNATLVRSHASDERQLIVIDFSRLLEAVRSMEWPSKYGDTTRLLDLFGSDVDVMLRVEGVKKSILIQLLVSDSPSELPLPNQSVKWTPEEYVKWYEEHTELEVLAFLNGLVSSYNSSVISRGQQHYVDHYPRIVKLLQNAF